jgi:hypothetical protein
MGSLTLELVLENVVGEVQIDQVNVLVELGVIFFKLLVYSLLLFDSAFPMILLLVALYGV